MEMSSGIFCQELWILILDSVIGKIKSNFNQFKPTLKLIHRIHVGREADTKNNLLLVQTKADMCRREKTIQKGCVWTEKFLIFSCVTDAIRRTWVLTQQNKQQKKKKKTSLTPITIRHQ